VQTNLAVGSPTLEVNQKRLAVHMDREPQEIETFLKIQAAAKVLDVGNVAEQ